MCKRCCNPIKAICNDLSDPMSRLIYDAIWNTRADRRETLVKKVAEKHIDSFNQLKEDYEELKKALKRLKELSNVSEATNNA